MHKVHRLLATRQYKAHPQKFILAFIALSISIQNILKTEKPQDLNVLKYDLLTIYTKPLLSGFTSANALENVHTNSMSVS